MFSNIVKHYTNKGDIVLDCFCGGGVTVFEAAALGRKAIGVDLNPLAAFITKMQMFTGDIEELSDFYRRFLLTIEKKYSDWYSVQFEDDRGEALWFEWVYTVTCPECGSEMVLTEENKVSNGIYRCPDLSCRYREGVKRVACQALAKRPVRVLYVSEETGKRVIRPFTTDNVPAFKNYDFKKIIDGVKYKPQFKIPDDWDRQYEDKLQQKGILNYSDFFTDRNYALNCLIFNDIMNLKEKTDSKLNEYLYFLFSSSLRYTNNMTRVTDKWENGNPTSMDKHAFWLPNQYVETNILDVMKKRAAAILKGCKYSSENLPKDLVEAGNFDELKSRKSFMILNRSSSDVPLPDEGVDVIITDPPYGSNVQYAELSTIWNAWYAIYHHLDNYIYKEKEAVVNRKSCFSGAKSEEDYERLLYEVYSEGARVLKPGGYLVFTFNNKNIKVWIAMLKAVARAGFYLPEDGIIFQDYIESYKNTAHLRFSGNIQGDFIYSFRKGKPEFNAKIPESFSKVIEDLIDETVEKLFKQQKEYSMPELYQNILTCLTRNMMQYIMQCVDSGTEIESVTKLSNAFLENRLKQTLEYSDGIWRKKTK